MIESDIGTLRSELAQLEEARFVLSLDVYMC